MTGQPQDDRKRTHLLKAVDLTSWHENHDEFDNVMGWVGDCVEEEQEYSEHIIY